MEVHNPAGSDLKCPTCLVSFQALQQHKDHYKSDFHRYNLKRKMVKLVPVSLQQFIAKRAYDAEQQQSSQLKCGQCGKKFASTKTFSQHIESKKHNPNLSRNQGQQKSQSPKKAVPFSKNSKVCLFCLASHQTFSDNLRHMQSSHSFFIPQLNYCTNQEGLICYLQEKIQIGFMCIQCQNKNAKDFNSGQSVRKHMADKGHCFMKVQDGYDEYLQYYDFSSQFKQIVQQQKDRYVPGIQYTTLQVVTKGETVSDGKQKVDQADWQDQQSGEEQIKQDGEDDEQWQSEGEQGVGKQQQIKQKVSAKKPTHKSSTTYHIMRPTHTATGQLLLPNGKILGHRKYRYLYRQTIRPFWANNKIKMLGYNQYTHNSNNNALACRQKLVELAKEDRVMWRSKNKWERRWVRDGMRNNGLQKYFRIQNSM